MEFIKQKKMLALFRGLVGVIILILLTLGSREFFGTFRIRVLEKALNHLSISSFTFIVIIGFVAFMPMCLYDYLISKKLKLDISYRKILKFGWISNAIAMVASIGDLVETNFRTIFYKNEIKDQNGFVKVMREIIILNPIGLSLLSIIYIVFYCNKVSFFTFSGVITIIVGLYISGLILYRLIKNREEDKQFLEYKYVISVSIVSFFQWFLPVILFFLILKIIGINIYFGYFFPVYLLSMILGIISMLPGGIGAFDLSILIGLITLGVPKEYSVLALVLYRVAYYINPLIIAGILFLIDFWKNTNRKLKSVIESVAGKVGVVFLRALVLISGAALLISNAVPSLVYRFKELKFLSYATEMHFSKALVIIVGFLLIVMSSLLKYKAKSIHYLTVIFLLVGTVLTIMKSFNYIAASYLILVAFTLAISKKEFSKDSFVIGIETIIYNVIIVVGFWLVYMIAVYLSFPFRVHGLSRIFRAVHAYRNLVSFSTMGMIAAFILIIITYLIGKYRNKIVHSTVDENLDRIKEILEKYNGTSLTHLVYLKDKYVYLSDKYDGMIQYSVYSDKLMVLGNPIGDSHTIKEFIEEFYDFADNYGYVPIFFEVSGQMLEVLHEFGYEFMKLGESAIVDVQNFTIAGQKMQKVRTCCNKINREGYSFEVVYGPFSSELLKEIREISDKWLDGRKEMGFSMGFFDEDYINNGPLGVVRDSEGVLKAFVTIMPTYGENKRFCSDLMRFSRDTPRGVMDYMFVQLLEWGKENNYETFDFGVAPLSNVGTSKYSFLSERLAYQLYYYGQRFYSFEGLKKFKGKYANSWEPKFLAYKSKLRLPLTSLQANLTVSTSRKK